VTADVVSILCDLISRPSVNPGPEEPDEVRGEARVADYVEDFLRAHGIAASRQPVLPGRDNVLGRIEGAPEAGAVLFEAHMDTVPAGAMERPFDPEVRDGRVYGRGACDTKGSLAAMLTALARVAEGGPRATVILAATADEEHLFRGVQKLVASGVRADVGVVGEPTGLAVVIAHRGAVRWRLRTSGRSAHSSRPDEGVNAIYAMAKVLAVLEDYGRRGLGPEHPLLPRPTLSVGRIAGGGPINVVPDRCEIWIDRRTLPGEETAEVVGDVAREIAARLGDSVRFEMLPPELVDFGMELPADHPSVQRVLRCVEAVRGEARTVGVGYGTDAGKLTRGGIPSVVLGPGDIAFAHSAQEHVEIDQLEQAAAIYERVMRG
jgi:acetylornithine deacetylase